MTPLHHLASDAATALYSAINYAESPDTLDELGRQMWRGYGEGTITEADASFLDDCIRRRRPLASSPVTLCGTPKQHTALPRLAARLCSRFRSRQHPRSPDRQASRERRRRLGGSSALPDTIRHHYTEGQRAVLCIVAGEVKHHGVCDLPIDKIAALAGVCRTTVQTTMHEARRLFHIKITERPVEGRKHLPNLVEITSEDWRKWIKRGSCAHRPDRIGSNAPNSLSTTKSIDKIIEKQRPPEYRKGASEGHLRLKRCLSEQVSNPVSGHDTADRHQLIRMPSPFAGGT